MNINLACAVVGVLYGLGATVFWILAEIKAYWARRALAVAVENIERLSVICVQLSDEIDTNDGRPGRHAALERLRASVDSFRRQS